PALGLILAVSGSVALAQLDPTVDPSTSTTSSVPPPPPPVTREMIEAPRTEEPIAEQPPEKSKVGFSWGLQVGVPIFLDVDRDIVKAGGDVSFFAGADFGYFIIGGTGGVGWNRINLNNQPDVTFGGKSPLTRVFLSVPEFRVQIPNLAIVLPYVSASFDMNFWNFRQTEITCTSFYCTDTSVYRFTPGFTARAGVGLEVAPSIYIDVGFRCSYSGEGNFFNQSRQWITPYFGVLIRAR
ncbi:MAG: hypothetical protein AAF436_16010, partial [Myxococcota bacterium]